ncbi:MAG: hypothetical protein IH955_11585 [Chloroflexi bacterium]|nr:hypothetical protein [Chloroflexota bacterium]
MSVGSGTFILDEETELSFNRGVYLFFGTYRMQGKGTVEAFGDRLWVNTGTLRSELTSDLGFQLNGATVEISAVGTNYASTLAIFDANDVSTGRAQSIIIDNRGGPALTNHRVIPVMSHQDHRAQPP